MPVSRRYLVDADRRQDAGCARTLVHLLVTARAAVAAPTQTRVPGRQVETVRRVGARTAPALVHRQLAPLPRISGRACAPRHHQTRVHDTRGAVFARFRRARFHDRLAGGASVAVLAEAAKTDSNEWRRRGAFESTVRQEAPLALDAGAGVAAARRREAGVGLVATARAPVAATTVAQVAVVEVFALAGVEARPTETVVCMTDRDPLIRTRYNSYFLRHR